MTQLNFDDIRFPRIPLLCAVVLSTLVTGWQAWTSIHAYQVAKGYGAQSAAFEETKGRILHLDEILTMSARMAAATGDLRWADRYERAVPELDEAMARVLEIGDQSIVPVATTLEANARLIEIESRAFDLVRQDRASTASAILQDREYLAQKSLYAQGMQDFIEQTQAHLRDIVDEEWVLVTWSLASGVLSVACLIGVWLYILSRVTTWRTLIASAHEDRKRAVEELAEHRDHLEELVAHRTVEVEKQAKHLERALEAQTEYNNLQREFVSMASHEFRTPLTIIDGTAQRILRKWDKLPTEKIHKYIDDIQSTVTRMIGLIDSTLTAERLNAGKVEMAPQPVDLTALLNTVRDRQQRISTSHEISLELGEMPAEVRADPQLLEHVFTNLLSNAVKYSPEAPQIEVTGGLEAEGVRISVRDHGVGIPAKDLARVFQRYFRAGTAMGFAGTGIGLNVVQRFVEMHGGSVDVQSTENQGTTFLVWLPIECGLSQRAVGATQPDGPRVTAAA